MRTSVGVGLLALITACGFPQPKDVGGDAGPGDAAVDSAVEDAPPDAAIDAPPGPCNLFMQTGCSAGEKCTYLRDQMNMSTYHVGCAPDGAVADGAACTFTATANGYDNCTKGSFCGLGDKCKPLCDPNAMDTCGVAGVCARHAEPDGIGLCIPRCDPLNDNAFKAGGTKPGTTCADNLGCYGTLSSDKNKPTAFTCVTNFQGTKRLVHRTQCTDATGCSSNGTIYVNSCSPGYQPLLKESAAVTTAICVAFCKPAPCYSGNCGTNGANAAGLSPHRCSTTDADGVFDTASGSNNGEHCMYSWSFEIDSGGQLVRSPTSDTVGICFDHKKYMYDSNGDGTADAVIPPCATLPLTSSPPSPNAVDWGCVDTGLAGLPFTGKARPRPPLDLRFPYSWRSSSR